MQTVTPARERLVAELREHALVIGKVTLSSGLEADYYVDAKRAILRGPGFLALGELVRAEAERWAPPPSAGSPWAPTRWPARPWRRVRT